MWWIRTRGADFWSGLVLTVLSIGVIREAFELEVGTPTSPGSGFMILGAGAALGLLAVFQLWTASRSAQRGGEAPPASLRWGRIVAVVLGGVVYVLLLEPVGYLLCTFLLLAFLFQVLEPGHWVPRTLGAAATSLLSYVVFAKLLQVSLPQGVISFF
jgi:putative tricarboxylic transport membrane protein